MPGYEAVALAVRSALALANVSIRPAGEAALGTRTELKNLNSFRNVRRALEYEIGRQERILGSGGEVVQETVLWDAAAGKTGLLAYFVGQVMRRSGGTANPNRVNELLREEIG
jgi:Asp-tRNA(Asn)/Glu-tRNA(Gln) amidotransferase B subunit